MSTGVLMPSSRSVFKTRYPSMPRQHEIEHDEIRRLRAHLPESCRSIRRDVDVVAFDLEIVAKASRQIAIVFDHENACHRRTSTSTVDSEST